MAKHDQKDVATRGGTQARSADLQSSASQGGASHYETFRALVEYGDAGDVAAFVESLGEQRDDLLAALKQLMKAYESVLPGLAKIAVQDYALINNAPVAAERAIAKAEGR